MDVIGASFPEARETARRAEPERQRQRDGPALANRPTAKAAFNMRRQNMSTTNDARSYFHIYSQLSCYHGQRMPRMKCSEQAGRGTGDAAQRRLPTAPTERESTKRSPAERPLCVVLDRETRTTTLIRAPKLDETVGNT